MNAHTIVIDSSVRMPNADIWFTLPAGFIALPLGENTRRPMSALADAVNSPEGQIQLLALMGPVQRMFHLLSYSGVIHCSMGLHRDDDGDGEVLPSLFTLSWKEIPWAPRRVTVSRLAVGTPDTRHVECPDLPCGPASLVETLLSQQVVGMAEEILQVAMHIPYPKATKLAVLTLSTTAVHRADHYRNLLLEVARMVTFENPLVSSRDEA